MRVTTPFKIWFQRLGFSMLVVAALTLIIVGRQEQELVENVRISVVEAVSPLLDTLAKPAEFVAEAVSTVGELAHLRGENARLREENQRLLRWEAVARRLEAENKAFRSLLNFVPEQPFRYISARVIADSSGAFVRSMLLAAGAENGVQKGQAAISGEGLVGRVAEVADHTSRILLVTDLNSRIPIRLESSRDRGILAGDNTDRPRIIYLPQTARVMPGDRVVTSGAGGVFPPGLAIGTIVPTEDDQVRVQPFANWNRLEYVRIVDINPEGIVGKVRSGRAFGGTGQ